MFEEADEFLLMKSNLFLSNIILYQSTPVKNILQPLPIKETTAVPEKIFKKYILKQGNYNQWCNLKLESSKKKWGMLGLREDTLNLLWIKQISMEK